MKTIPIAVAALLLLPLPAWSQTGMQSDDHDSSSSYRRDREDDGGSLRDFFRDMYRDRDGTPRGAFFNMRNGNAAVTVRCDPRDSMRACVEATIMLLDHANRMTPPGGTPSPTPGAETPPR